MNAREQAERLREEAIRLLLAERDDIDAELKRFGYDQMKAAPSKRRGRPPKQALAVTDQDSAGETPSSVPISDPRL